MADNHAKVADLQNRIVKERKIIAGFQAMRSATSNQDTIRSCDSKIRDSEKTIKFFEESIRELQGRASMSDGASMASHASAGSAGSSHGTGVDSGYGAGYGGNGNDRDLPPPPGQGRFAGQAAAPVYSPVQRKVTYSSLDLIKYDTPITAAKIARMISQLQFKVSVEQQYKQGIEKMSKLYQVEGDKKSRSEAESKRIESNQKMALLQQALKRYKGLEVVGLEDEDADSEERKGNFRRPLSGALQITITSAKDLDHAPLPKRGKAISESVVVVKVEDTARARTHPSRTDRWNEEFEIHVDKANEVEVTIYDKVGNETPIPVGLLWIRLNDVVEELRRRKVGNESGPGWVTAARVNSGGSGSGADNIPMGPGPGGLGGFGVQQGVSQGIGVPDGIDAWFAVEPAGAIGLHLNFVKSNVRKRPYEAGGLGRQGAFRKRKDSVHEQNGHQFILQQFYSIVRCALCSEFCLDGQAMQCEDCKYLCHKKCFGRVVTKCISKSNADATDADEDKMLNHRIPHRFEAVTSLTPTWCCHCGTMVGMSRKTSRKCSECGLASHADCTHLVPDFCGMSMEMANRLLQEIKTARSRQVGRLSAGTPKQDQISAAQMSPHRVQPPSSTSYDSLTGDMGRITVGQQTQQQDSYRRPPYSQPPPGRQDSRPPQDWQGTPSDGRTFLPGSAPQTRVSPQQQQQLPPTEEESVVGSIFGDYAGSTPPSGLTSAPVPVGRPLPPQPSHPEMPASQQNQRPLSQPPAGMSQQLPSSHYPGRLPPGAQAPQYGQDLRLAQQQQQPQTVVQRPSSQPPSQKQPPSPTRLTKQRKVGLDDFNFLAVLGKGNFGKVMLAEEKRSAKLWAIKVLKKDFIIENDEVESTKSEKRVFIAASREQHPFLISLHSCFQTETRIYFVMEYVSGGDLMLHIQREQFTPRRAKFYASEVLLALEYFHKNGIVYRDLKLDNILLTLDGHVKVADYGLCKEEMWYQSATSTFCGTPEFMAPEILLEQRYGRAVDWWAFGVLIYEMLLGQSPFKGDDEDEIFDAILEDEPLYPIHMPRDSVQILQRLLTREPQRRLGSGPNDAEEIKAHPFFREVNWSDVYHKRIPAPYFPTVNGLTDVSNFDQEFTREPPRLTPVHSVLGSEQQAEFQGFSYTSAWAN